MSVEVDRFSRLLPISYDRDYDDVAISEEASIRIGEQNKIEIERNQLLKEILAENKNRRKSFQIKEVSF